MLPGSLRGLSNDSKVDDRHPGGKYLRAEVVGATRGRLSVDHVTRD